MEHSADPPVIDRLTLTFTCFPRIIPWQIQADLQVPGEEVFYECSERSDLHRDFTQT